MKLGILVNTDRHLDHVMGITKAALKKGHTVTLFNMDDGAKLLRTPEFQELCKTEGVKMIFCEYNARRLATGTGGLPEEMVSGSQYNNAVMNHDSDRVIVL